jgi:hypothetical protein
MKYLFLLLFLFSSQFNAFTAVIRQIQNSEKIYFHKPTGKTLHVERVEQGLLVKGWFSDKKRLFERIRKGLFIDFKGNRIEIKNDHELVYVKRNSRKGLVFTQEFSRDHYGQANIRENQSSVNDCNQLNIEGLWFDRETNTYLVVVSTREGIKVRLKDSRIWYTYIVKGNEFTFQSNEGHSYVFQNGILQYFHNDAINQMTFYKISDSFDGY